MTHSKKHSAFTRLFHILLSLPFIFLLNTTATALSCPSSGDFIHVDGYITGWSWGLRSDSAFNLNGSSSIWSPKETDFSPSSPLDVDINSVILNLEAGTVSIRFDCYYAKQDLSTSVKRINISLAELDRISHLWEHDFGSYSCRTTAGEPDRCNINELPQVK